MFARVSTRVNAHKIRCTSRQPGPTDRGKIILKSVSTMWYASGTSGTHPQCVVICMAASLYRGIPYGFFYLPATSARQTSPDQLMNPSLLFQATDNRYPPVPRYTRSNSEKEKQMRRKDRHHHHRHCLSQKIIDSQGG